MKILLLDLTKQYRDIQKDIDSVVKQVLNSGHFILGENVAKFEEEFARYSGTKYAVGVGNGTDALELSLRALRIARGDGVITTPFTFIATAEAITSSGARPIFVDINLDTYNIDVEGIDRILKHKNRKANVKAIIPVHLYGQACNIEAIVKLAKRYNLKLIEDCAQSAGAEFNGRRVGSFGDCGCFSFFPSKNLGAYGDGGMVVTNNKELAERLQMLRFHGAKDKYHHILKGRNSRLDELQAAILRVKLRHLDKWNLIRRHNASIYSRALAELSSVIRIPAYDDTALRHIYHIYAIRLAKRDDLKDFLKKSGIETGLHYPVPAHLEKVFRYLGYKRGDFPNAERAASEVLSLPMFPELSKRQIFYVVNQIKKWLSV